MPDVAGQGVYLTGGGDAVEVETELQVHSGGDGDEEDEEEELLVQDEEEAEEEVQQFGGLVRGEAEYGTTVSHNWPGISPAEDFLGPEWDAESNLSVTTAWTVTTQQLQGTRLKEWIAPPPENLPDINLYHPEEFLGAIKEEIKNHFNLVLNTPYFAYNWIGPVSTTLCPLHTSEDGLIT